VFFAATNSFRYFNLRVVFVLAEVNMLQKFVRVVDLLLLRLMICATSQKTWICCATSYICALHLQDRYTSSSSCDHDDEPL